MKSYLGASSLHPFAEANIISEIYHTLYKSLLLLIVFCFFTAMSKATKRKHVLLRILDDDSHPTADQLIVKVVSSRGNNLHAVEAPDGANFLVSMPTKFRRNVWIKRGDYVLVDPIKEGDKVKAEIVRVLTPELIKCFKNDGVWPSAFEDYQKNENDDDLFVNRNRVQANDYGDISSSSDSSSESDTD